MVLSKRVDYVAESCCSNCFSIVETIRSGVSAVSLRDEAIAEGAHSCRSITISRARSLATPY